MLVKFCKNYKNNLKEVEKTIRTENACWVDTFYMYISLEKNH